MIVRKLVAESDFSNVMKILRNVEAKLRIRKKKVKRVSVIYHEKVRCSSYKIMWKWKLKS